MKIKIGLARALKIARANGYDGADDFDSVTKWYSDSNVRSEDGHEVEVVKTVTISVKADAGEQVVVSDDSAGGDGAAEPPMDTPGQGGKSVAVSETELRRLREKARELDATKGIQSSGVNGVMASIHAGGGLSPKSYERMSGRKTYNAKAKLGRTVWTDAEEADVFGALVRLSAFGWRPYGERANDEAIVRKANVTTSFTSAGALMPPQFVQRLIDIRKEYGVIESLLYAQPMTGDTATTPRRTGGLTVYGPGEAQAATESNPAFDQVELVARKRLTLTKVSTETMEDSAFSMADIVANEIAWSFAKDDDDRGINGDGNSGYAGDVGLRHYIKALSSTIGDIAGLFVGAGNTYAELTYNDFLNTAALLPAFRGARTPAQWLMHPRFYKKVVRPLAHAAGGSTGTERLDGISKTHLDGDPIVFSELMPRAEGNSQVCALFGHFDMAGTYGRVRSMEIASSVDSDFANDLIAIRGRQRSAITIHDMGNADATEDSREPGPVVGLITAGS